MGLLDAIVDVVSMPIHIAVDIVQLPKKIMTGKDELLENTTKGIEKIKEDLDNG